MSDTFVCSVCGQMHAGFQTDEAFELPDDVWILPKEERASKAKFDSNMCILGDRHFIRCVLAIPFTEMDGYFGWGIWIEVAAPVFWRYFDVFEVDASAEPRHPGRIANALPVYPGALGAEVVVQFGTRSQRPRAYLLAGDSSRFATDQRQGIDSRRYHEIVDGLRAKDGRTL